MGTKSCCCTSKTESENINDCSNELELANCLKVKRYELGIGVSNSTRESSNSIKMLNRSESERSIEKRKNIENIVNGIEGNFYKIAICSAIDKIEERISKETYRDFYLVRARISEFLEFHTEGNDCNLLKKATQQLHDWLDKQKEKF